MELDKKLDITIMVQYPEFLEKAIINHNKFEGTDFKIIETIFDEIVFCRVVAHNYTEKDLFSLGYKVSFLENKFNRENNRR